ncbi:acetyltransferase [Castellaniella hirudinis]|uniref:Acetyltransferase n=1 Tax=Castellaniella hirudinis TaxID=1144617 RepID=A0ABV8RTX9_9BURK
MNEPLYAVYGASGFGREVLPLGRESLARAGIALDRLVFIDDEPPMPQVNGHRVLTWQAFLDEPAGARFVSLAIASGAIREKLSNRLRDCGVSPWDIRAGNMVQLDDVAMGEGAILCAFVTLTSNIRIGRQFHANIYSYVAHDCVIGDFVTFAPGVMCNGNVVVEDHAYIGTGAILRQGKPGQPLRIGRGAVVGMGAVVTKDVAAGVTVVGNPARPLLK